MYEQYTHLLVCRRGLVGTVQYFTSVVTESMEDALTVKRDQPDAAI